MKIIESIYFGLSLLFFKLKGISIGKRSKLWLSGSTYNGQYLTIGEDCVIHKNWQINSYTNSGGIKNQLVGITIGDRVDIGRNFSCYCAGKVEIKNDTLIGGNVLITDNNHGMSVCDKPYHEQALIIKETIVNEGVWIGEGCYILAGSVIGKKSIIGANSVVSGTIPDYSIAVGSPARVIKKYDFEKKDWIKVDE